MNVQLFNYHTAGAQVRIGPASVTPVTFQAEASGNTTSNAVNPHCRFRHSCSRCSGDHRETSCTSSQFSHPLSPNPEMASKFGPGALLAKFDTESAYRHTAIHPLDHHLLGFKWHNSYYMDLALPFFGLRSALAIFNAVADLGEWILVNSYGIDDLCIKIDDFILAAPANSLVCASNLQVAFSLVARLGLPLHPQKCLGPASCIVFLGIELDTAAQIARLSADKFSAIQEVLSH